MIGLDGIYRAYSLVSTSYDDYLEFLSIKVPDGPLTSKLAVMQPGDKIDIKPKTTGSLCIDYLYPKDNLILLCTGTGIAPFMSIVRDHETYDKFKHVHLYHTTRHLEEQMTPDDQMRAMKAERMLSWTGTVTRPNPNRFLRNQFLLTGRFWPYLEADFKNDISKDTSAIMVCGSPSLNKECRTKFSGWGWEEGNHGEMGDFLLERAFAG